MDSSTDTKKIVLCKAIFTQKQKKWRSYFTPFISKSFQIWDYFFPLLFPKGSESLKFVDIRLWEVGTKKTFKWYLKSEQTDGRTHGHTDTGTDISTYRKNQPRRLILWNSSWNKFSSLFLVSAHFSLHTIHFLLTTHCTYLITYYHILHTLHYHLVLSTVISKGQCVYTYGHTKITRRGRPRW